MRRALISDIATVQAITRDAYAAFQALIGVEPWPVREDYRPRIEQGEVWLMEVDGEAVGVISVEHHADHLDVFSVAVRTDRQGRGHGRAMLDLADRQAAQAGFDEVRLYTNALMERQIALYERCGYRVVARRPHPFLEGHTLVDMTKRLSPRPET